MKYKAMHGSPLLQATLIRMPATSCKPLRMSPVPPPSCPGLKAMVKRRRKNPLYLIYSELFGIVLRVTLAFVSSFWSCLCARHSLQ